MTDMPSQTELTSIMSLFGDTSISLGPRAFGWRKELKRVKDESVDTCAVNECPGLIDVIELDETYSFFYIPIQRKRNRLYVSCSKCGYLETFDIFQRDKLETMGRDNYEIWNSERTVPNEVVIDNDSTTSCGEKTASILCCKSHK